MLGFDITWCRSLALGAAVVTLVATPATAHHSFAVYDQEAVVSLSGTVVSYEWKNPHVYLYVDAEMANGDIVRWAVEGEPTALMSRAGWGPRTLAPGDRIFVRGHANRSPERREARLVTATLDDGTVLARRSVGAAARVPTDSLEGVWDAIRGYQDFELARGPLTERGAAAVAAFDETSSPVQDCVSFPAPMVSVLPYRTRITIGADAIVFKSEYYDTERIIYMDGRAHPMDGRRSVQGHSIGRWDGDALVVDTTLFADHEIGNFRGLPSGPRKHVIERFEPTADRTRLKVSFHAEDPDYLAEPWIGESFWDYVPNGETLPYRCDLDVARRFAIP